jgi:hypothetical protein
LPLLFQRGPQGVDLLLLFRQQLSELLQFARVETIGRGGRVIGCAANLDQRETQNRNHDYGSFRIHLVPSSTCCNSYSDFDQYGKIFPARSCTKID